MMNDTEQEHVCGTNHHRGSAIMTGDDGEADLHQLVSSSSSMVLLPETSSPLVCSDVIDHACPSTHESSPRSSDEMQQHNRVRRRRQQQHAGGVCVFLLLGVIMMAVTMPHSGPSTVNAFTSLSVSPSSHRPHDRLKVDMFGPAPTSTSSSSPSPSSRLGMSLHEVSDFYATYPLQSAILTCGFKASVADSIAQFKDRMKGLVETQERDDDDESDHWWEARRNTAYVIYGGLFVGLMCHMEYNVLFPAMFGTENTPTTFISKVLFDNFISAPVMWLPPAYLIKAVLYDYSLGEGLEKYWRDIRDEGLLYKYWTIWVPAQAVSFSVVPEHLRVAFMASISFFWFILFSSVSSNGDNTKTDNIDAVSPTPDHSDAAIDASFFDQPARKSQTMSFDSLHDLYHQDIGVILEAEVSRRVIAQKGSARSPRT